MIGIYRRMAEEMTRQYEVSSRKKNTKPILTQEERDALLEGTKQTQKSTYYDVKGFDVLGEF